MYLLILERDREKGGERERKRGIEVRDINQLLPTPVPAPNGD